MPTLNTNSSITISRKSTIGGAAIPFHILIDGESAGKVNNGKTVTIPVSSGIHKVCIVVPIWHRNNRSDEITIDLSSTQSIKLTCGYRAPSFVYLMKS